MIPSVIRSGLKLGAWGLVLTCSPVLAAQTASTVPWTFLVYMVGDNDLEEYVPNDLETELALVGSNPEVNVLALADRAPGYSTAAGNWTDTKLFYVTKGMVAEEDSALEDWGERNMGDPQTLLDFMDYASLRFPSERTVLVLWDHGWGWRPYQSIWDETDDDTLDQHELAAVLALKGGVDVLAYDACLMQDIEVLANTKGLADAMVASQDYVGYEGFWYEDILSELEADPAMSNHEVAVLMSENMTDRTISAVSLGPTFDTLQSAVDSWAVALSSGLPTWRSQYARAFSNAQAFGDPLYVDLYDAARLIKSLVSDSTLKNTSQAVMDAVNAATLYEWHRRFYRGAHGISIFWPQTPADLDEPSSPQWNDFEYYRTYLEFSANTRWDEFLASYVGGARSSTSTRRDATLHNRVAQGAPGLGLPAARGYDAPEGARRGAVR